MNAVSHKSACASYLQNAHAPSDFIAMEDIELFCKNIMNIHSLQTRPLFEELEGLLLEVRLSSLCHLLLTQILWQHVPDSSNAFQAQLIESISDASSDPYCDADQVDVHFFFIFDVSLSYLGCIVALSLVHCLARCG